MSYQKDTSSTWRNNGGMIIGWHHSVFHYSWGLDFETGAYKWFWWFLEGFCWRWSHKWCTLLCFCVLRLFQRIFLCYIYVSGEGIRLCTNSLYHFSIDHSLWVFGPIIKLYGCGIINCIIGGRFLVLCSCVWLTFFYLFLDPFSLPLFLAGLVVKRYIRSGVLCISKGPSFLFEY